MSNERELSPPPAADDNADACEVARIWKTADAQHLVLRADAYDDPAAWGVCLVDIARHLALAYERTTGRSAAQVLERIRQGFDAEWESPTDTPSGYGR